MPRVEFPVMLALGSGAQPRASKRADLGYSRTYTRTPGEKAARTAVLQCPTHKGPLTWTFATQQ